jgi:hypothetical protein
MLQIGQDAFAVHKIRMIPFFRVQPDNLNIIIPKFINLIQIIHLSQYEMEIDQHLIILWIFPQVGEFFGYLLKVFGFEVTMIYGGISEEVEEFGWKMEGV